MGGLREDKHKEADTMLSNSLATEEFMLLGGFFETLEPERDCVEGMNGPSRGCNLAVEGAGAGTKSVSTSKSDFVNRTDLENKHDLPSLILEFLHCIESI